LLFTPLEKGMAYPPPADAFRPIGRRRRFRRNWRRNRLWYSRRSWRRARRFGDRAGIILFWRQRRTPMLAQRRRIIIVWRVAQID
jgi:hypothetical protein